MLPVEWPIAAQAAADEPARRAGRNRLPVVRRDLFLDDAARLTEQERALMSAMLSALVEQIADEIRLGLSPDILAHAEHDRDSVLPRLWRSGALDRPTLILLLLRRADEQSIRAACRDRRAIGEGGIVERLVGDADGLVAGAAMALAVARGRRRDRFGRMGLEFDDIPPEEASSLVHLIAGAIRTGIAPSLVMIDEALAAATARLLDRHDEHRRVEGREANLAEALYAARGPDDELIADLAADGDAALIAACCAVRAGISPDTAWLLLVDDGASDAMMLARLAELTRPAAASLVASFGEPLSWGDPGNAIACFDGATPSDVDSARRWWRLSPSYRAALADQGGSHGQPRV